MLVCLVAFAMLLPFTDGARALPDGRAYELVSPVERNGVIPGMTLSSPDGNTVDWTGLGGLGDATSGAFNLYQSQRGGDGWQTTSPSPAPVVPLGFLELQAPIFWSTDLGRVLYTTPEPYAAGDQDGGSLDLYMEQPNGELTWISQGTKGGTARFPVTFDGATRDGNSVVFNTAESLVAAAVGAEETPYNSAAYLYVRDVSHSETQLVNVGNEGTLLNTEGAILGNGGDLTTGEPPVLQYEPSDQFGTTTNAISNDGSKIFFESPAPADDEYRISGREHPVHLYMRENGDTTVQLDGSGPGESRYAGASEDGSRVFFLSNEGLAGAPSDQELYEYDTDTETLTPISVAEGPSGPVDGAVVGVSAISNDGSHVYYIAKGRLADNANSEGELAEEGAPNLYVYDTDTGKNTFIAVLDTADTEPAPEKPGPLVLSLDIERPAIPTPDGSVLVFESKTDLTGQNASAFGEIYRYEASTGALECLSCTPFGVEPTGSATFGATGGGSYAPSDYLAPMSVDGSRVFFESPDSLTGPAAAPGSSTTSVYEWEGGTVAPIAEGRPQASVLLNGTTPSGDDVFFTTALKLVPKDVEDGEFNIYDARVDGGFPESGPPPASSCEGSGCRAPLPPPPTFGVPASAQPQEVGGAVSPTPKVQAKVKTKVKRRVAGRRSKRSRHRQVPRKAGRSQRIPKKVGRSSGRGITRAVRP
jgi:hypothetical protein